MKPSPIIRRTSDGALFMPIDKYGPTSGTYIFYEIAWESGPWYWPFKRWVKTGFTWISSDDKDWEVVT